MSLIKSFGRNSRRTRYAALSLSLMAVAAIFIICAPARAAAGTFDNFAGSWSGEGTLRPEGAQPERIRCNAAYRPAGTSLDLKMRCASDSYNFDLSGNFSVGGGNQITGNWTERTRGVNGIATGTADGDNMLIHVEAAGFAATLRIATSKRRQDVSIDSHGGGQNITVKIALKK